MIREKLQPNYAPDFRGGGASGPPNPNRLRTGENPFVSMIGRPCPPERVVGRDDMVSWKMGEYLRGENIWNKGEAGLGKSSFIGYLRHVFGDRQTMASVRAKLGSSVPREIYPIYVEGATFASVDPKAASARFFADVNAGIAKQLAERGARTSYRSNAEPNYSDEYHTLQEMLGVLERRGGRAIILGDDMDIAFGKVRLDAGFQMNLRYLVSGGKPISLLATASRGMYETLAGGESYGSPLFNVFHVDNLGGLSPEAAEQLLAVGQFSSTEISVVLSRAERQGQYKDTEYHPGRLIGAAAKVWAGETV